MTAVGRIAAVRRSFGRRGISASFSLDEYQRFAALTNRSRLSGRKATNFLILGLYGEVGSLLSELKKKQRDPLAYKSYEDSAVEELGDVLWYFSNLATNAGLSLSTVAGLAAQPGPGHEAGAGNPRTFADLQRRGRQFGTPSSGAKAEMGLLRLANRVGQLVDVLVRPHPGDAAAANPEMVAIWRTLVEAADDAGIGLEGAALGNLEKAVSRWPFKRDWGSPYDEGFDPEERLPRRMEIRFTEKKIRDTRYVLQQWKGVNIGDRLTDNRAEPDDYRFHDVFHLSYAAYLGWSPVLRALLRVKRKSRSEVDEQQDGARAIITEEGISNWIFEHGKRHHLFRKGGSLDFSLLRTIRDMVRGYEVESRPLWMWEEAILAGFRVFRQLKDNRGGIVTADLNKHMLTYRNDRR